MYMGHKSTYTPLEQHLFHLFHTSLFSRETQQGHLHVSKKAAELISVLSEHFSNTISMITLMTHSFFHLHLILLVEIAKTKWH